MAMFEVILALLIAGVFVSLLAPRLGVPAPALLALVGAMASFIPGMPSVTLDPELALAVFLAPILFTAGYATSPRDLQRNWAPIGGLVVVAIGLTTVCVAVVAHWLMPEMPWAIAIALGAVVAPPDAAAANAVLRKVRLPHRMMVILEGESLLNDATALLVYRASVGAVVGGVSVWTAPLLILSIFGGVMLGAVLAYLYVRATARLDDKLVLIVFQIVGCCGVWLIAERLELSAVLTIVSFAVTIKRFAKGRIDARDRRNIHAVWEVVIFVLNLLAFMLVGLQLRGIVERLDDLTFAALFAAAILVTVILARFAWVITHAIILRRLDKDTDQAIPLGQAGLIAWCGLRGIVTLAAALALPLAFPYRDLIVFAAFCTVLGTLVLQGFSLQPLLARLNISLDGTVDEECALARTESARAVLDELDGQWTGPGGYLVRQDYRARLRDSEAAEVSAVIALRRRAFAIERRVMAQMLRLGRIGDTSFHQMEEALDWTEAESTTAAGPRLKDGQSRPRNTAKSSV